LIKPAATHCIGLPQGVTKLHLRHKDPAVNKLHASLKRTLFVHSSFKLSGSHVLAQASKTASGYAAALLAAVATMGNGLAQAQSAATPAKPAVAASSWALR
jgi:hypothetical protein